MSIKWLWPVPGTTISDISQYYTGKVGVGHSGIDIYTDDIFEDSVVASRDGTVVMILSGCVNHNSLTKEQPGDCSTELGCTGTIVPWGCIDGVTRNLCNDSVGNMVILEHEITNDDGTISYQYSQYCHLLSIDVSLNQTVFQGDKIGTVGSTGESQAPHLHFSLSRDYLYWGDSRYNNNPSEDVVYIYEVETPTPEPEPEPEVETVTVSFYDDLEKNGGKLIGTRTYTVGSAYGSFPTPDARTGYTFDKWYTATGGYVETWSPATSGRTKLYAHWTAKPFTVTCRKNDGTNVSNKVDKPMNM